MTKKYSKLVRDKIPDIIKAKGDTCKIKILSDEEYIKLLDLKLNEEVAEYQSDKSLDELADILEVIYAITKLKGYSVDFLENLRLKKAQNRGSFDEKIMLVEVYENDGGQI